MTNTQANALTVTQILIMQPDEAVEALFMLVGDRVSPEQADMLLDQGFWANGNELADNEHALLRVIAGAS